MQSASCINWGHRQNFQKWRHGPAPGRRIYCRLPVYFVLSWSLSPWISSFRAPLWKIPLTKGSSLIVAHQIVLQVISLLQPFRHFGFPFCAHHSFSRPPASRSRSCLDLAGFSNFPNFKLSRTAVLVSPAVDAGCSAHLHYTRCGSRCFATPWRVLLCFRNQLCETYIVYISYSLLNRIKDHSMWSFLMPVSGSRFTKK